MELGLATKLENKERINKYKTLQESIKDGHLEETQELFAARDKNLITAKQCDLLVFQLVDNLKKNASIDSLTKINNRALLGPQLAKVREELNHEGGEKKYPVQSVMVIFLDVKDFKKLNDEHGHAVGDRALIIVAERLKKSIKRNDSAFRVGGDEFIALLPINENNPQTCEAIFERIKNKINADLSVNDGTQNIPFSISMGFEILNKGDDTTSEEVLEKADKKMYVDKNKMLN